jgi:CRP-like cAMP-binding protein
MLNIDKELKRIFNEYPDLREEEKYKRNENVVVVDTIITKSYYIKSGILKFCLYDKERDKNIIFDLLHSGDAILPCSAIPYDTASPFNIRVIEDAVIYTISNDNLKIIREKEPQFEELTNLNLRRMFQRVIKIAIVNSYPNVLTRYEKLLEVYPYLNSVSPKDVAAIFGVDRTTITRKKTERYKIEKAKQSGKIKPKNTQ